MNDFFLSNCGRSDYQCFNTKSIINIQHKSTVLLSNSTSVIERIFVRRPRNYSGNILSVVDIKKITISIFKYI